MSIEIRAVKSAKDLKKFIQFPYKLYKNVPQWVPALEGDEYDTLDRKKNGAFEYCDSEMYLAYKDGELAGRVAAIINFKANEKWGEKNVRFGWLDFIEDEEVLKALMDSVIAWGRKHGCTMVKGPLGFTDMDKEGLLVEGYGNLSPFTCLYNFPYYDTLLQKLGFCKDVDWTQKVAAISPELPPMFKLAPVIEKKFGLSIAKARNTREMVKKYGLPLFHMYNETFAPLFQFTPLTDRQIKRYLQTYQAILSPDFIAICLNAEGQPIGFAFCVPSLSKAVKKAKGRLFPFGFIHILRALRKNDTLEALMIGILPEYQGTGANVLLFKHIHENALKKGISRMILNPQLENNFKVQSLFEQYETTPYMRRRSYCLKLD